MADSSDPEIDIDELFSSTNEEPITETITESNIDESDSAIVETLYSTSDPDELIGYACKTVVSNNAVEPIDLIFYMDILTPAASEGDSSPQEAAVAASQKVLLRELSREFQIDATISQGLRCYDLPVDGSTWIVQMSFETRDFVEVTLFGGCRELEWDDKTQDCNFYEARMRGSYIGAYATDSDGNPFGDAVGMLEKVINGPKIVEELTGTAGKPSENYSTLFKGVPRANADPNFQGGADQGRGELKEPTNLKTGIQSSQASANRKTITVVGGLLVACFSIAFFMVGYILWKRRRSYRNKNLDDDDGGMEVVGGYNIENVEVDNRDSYSDDEGHEDEPGEYPNLPMSAEAIQMDLGNTLKSQMGMDSGGLYSPQSSTDDHDLLNNDVDTDSWAQTEGTIGSLELQLEPITAEV